MEESKKEKKGFYIPSQEVLNATLANPIITKSTLLGIGCGSIILAHKLRINRGFVFRALSDGILAGSIICMGNIYFSLSKFKEKLKFVEDYNRQQEMQRIVANNDY